MVWYSHLSQNFPQLIVIHTLLFTGSHSVQERQRGPDTPRLGTQALAGLCSHLGALLGKSPLLSSFRLLAEFSSLWLQVEAPAFSLTESQEQLLEADHTFPTWCLPANMEFLSRSSALTHVSGL